jgi:hypothetical protein
MTTLALLLLLAAPGLASEILPPAPSTGTVALAKLKLQVQDTQGALKDAEAAVANGGGADAYAALADAKFAVGRPIDEVIAEYAEAMKLDPKYAVKYKGLITQRDSEANRRTRLQTGGMNVGSGANGFAMLLAVSAISCLLFVVFLVMVQGHEKPVSPPEDERPKQEPPREDV